MLEVAGRLFATRGYTATSMDQIAAGAGISKPMLYAYFGSKHGLYLAYMRQAAERLFERLLGAAPPELPAAERLLLGLDAFLAFVDERRDGWALLFQQATAQDGPLASEVSARRTRLVAMATRILTELAAERGERPPAGELEALGHGLIGAAESLANWWLGHPEVPRAQVLRALVELTRVELPRVELPRVELPRVELPRVELPRVELPLRDGAGER
jgi:AcrR family transcriptional regulator